MYFMYLNSTAVQQSIEQDKKPEVKFLFFFSFDNKDNNHIALCFDSDNQMNCTQ